MTVMVVFSTELFHAELGRRVITSKTVCPFLKECSVLLESLISVPKALLFGKKEGGNLADC